MEEIKRKKIGIALGSGGPRGQAHIGVIKALLENNIPIDCIAGSSAGALVGGFFAAFNSISEVERITASLTYKDLAKVFSDVGFYSGIIHGKNMIKLLRQFIGERTIESLPIPFCAVATNMETGEPVIITKGGLAEAIRASSAIPIIFYPHKEKDVYLVDGGCSCPVPVQPVKDLGADFVIAINLDAYGPRRINAAKKPKIMDLGNVTIDLFKHNLAKQVSDNADIVITPDVQNVSFFNFKQYIRGESIIQKGYNATTQKIAEIKAKISE